MKTIVYLIVLLIFILPTGARLEPVGLLSTRDTLPTSDTIPNLARDSSRFFNDSLIIIGDTLSSLDTFVYSGKQVKGVASYYSKKFEGRKTANGDIFRHTKMTAASNHFKLNTFVKVTNQKNKKSVIVLINDRMHNRMKKKGRVVDLSKSAAKELDFIKNGIAKVTVVPLIPFSKKQLGISSE